MRSFASRPPTTLSLPFLLLLFSFLQFLQVFLGELDDVGGLLLGGQQRVGGEGTSPAVERLAGGGSGQILPEVLIHSFALQEFGSEDSGRQTSQASE